MASGTDDEKAPLLKSGRFHSRFDSRITIDRKVYLQDHLNEEQEFQNKTEPLLKQVKRKIKQHSFRNFILDLIPILRWLPTYNCKDDIVGDLLAGFTVAVMHIPQGMAYALLGNVPPIWGIYMGFFPIIIYSLLGTSRHVSMGGFAITSLMTGNIVAEYVAKEIGYDSTLIAGTVSFAVGIIFVFMYLIRVGILADLLSEPLINAFTSASAFHIITSQIKDLFGLTGVRRTSGTYKLIKTIKELVSAAPTVNPTTVVISTITIVCLVANNQLVKPWLAKRTKIPFPIELFVVVTGTLTSYFMDLPKNYSVANVGVIQRGFPEVRMPVFSIIPDIIYDCFFIALVSYTITMSMALLFANKKGYEIKPNQELFAMGLSDITGSIFGCMPITASLSRSLIQVEVGGRTQLTSLISCTFLIFVLLWIGALFSSLPRAILACIIVVALKNMLVQIKDCKKFWTLNKWDFIVWICTFATTLLINIDIGLFLGFLLSLTSIFVRGFKPYTCLLGHIPGTDLYLDIKKYKNVQELPKIRIFRYCGGLNFASKASFKSLLFKRIGFDPINPSKVDYESVIMDFSSLTFIDPQGVQILNEISKMLFKSDVTVYICSCSVPVFQVIQNTNSFYEELQSTLIFPTVHDAVLYATSKMNMNYKSKNVIDV